MFLKNKIPFSLTVLLLIVLSCKAQSKGTSNVKNSKLQEHPSLILTKEGVEKIKANLGTVPLFDKTLEKVYNYLGRGLPTLKKKFTPRKKLSLQFFLLYAYE